MARELGLLLAALLALVGGSALGQVLNTEVTRNIDASTSIVKLTAEIKAVNVKGEYELAFPTATAKAISFLSVTLKGKALPIGAPVR